MSDLHAGFQRPDANARHDELFGFLERVDELPDQGTARRVLDALGGSVVHRWTGRTLARTFHRAGLRDIVTEPRPITCPPASITGSSARPWLPRWRRGHSRLRPTGTGWRPRRTPNGAGITATPSSGWSSRPASPIGPAPSHPAVMVSWFASRLSEEIGRA